MNFNALHGILVSFTLALIPISFASELAGRLRRSEPMRIVGWWTLLYAAIATPLAAFAAWMWVRMVPEVKLFAGDLLQWHTWAGVGIAVSLLPLVIWRGWMYRREKAPGVAYLLLLGILAVASIYQGNWGRALAFGEMPVRPLNPLHVEESGHCH